MNIKRFLLILPLTFILILGLVPTGSALAADEDYFLPSGSLGIDVLEDSVYLRQMAIDSVTNNASETVKSYFENCNYQDLPYYFTMIDMGKTIYENNFIPDNANSSFNITYLFVGESTPTYDDDDYFAYPISGCFVTLSCLYDFQLDSFTVTNTSFGYSTTKQFIFNKSNARYQYINSSSVPNWSASSYSDFRSTPKYIFFADSNFAPLPDGINSGGSGLNVDVRFRPGLSGEVDRMLEDSEGVRSLMSDMRMTVVNNSRTAIQYKMAIYKKNQVTHRDYNISNGRDAFISASYDDDPIFVYYSNEWVYSTDLSSSSNWYNGHVQKQNKGTEWHYVSAGGAVAVRLNYSQINLLEGTEYTCIVQAVACPYDSASRMWVTQASSEAAYPEYKQIFSDDIEVVYQSDFIMTHYSDVHYDPNDTSNGVLPYSKYSDGESYTFSYNAVEDSEGNVDYTPKNLYTDKSSWWHTQYHPDDITVPGGFSSGGSTFNNLGSTVSSFFSLITSVLGYFPSSVNTVFGLGVIALVVAGFFKAVFRS